jgi:hypothetical protein
MPTWLWLNIFWGALFVLAIVGVPLWLVIARPDAGRQDAPASRGRGARTEASRQPSPHPPDLAAVARAEGSARAPRAGVS